MRKIGTNLLALKSIKILCLSFQELNSRRKWKKTNVKRLKKLSVTGLTNTKRTDLWTTSSSKMTRKSVEMSDLNFLMTNNKQLAINLDRALLVVTEEQVVAEAKLGTV